MYWLQPLSRAFNRKDVKLMDLNVLGCVYSDLPGLGMKITFISR